MSAHRKLQGERGSSLVMALMFLSIFGLLSIVILGFGDVSIRATAGYRTQRARNYATDAALQAGINRVRHDATIGRDPGVFSTDTCNPSNAATLLNLPASGTSPTMMVTCQVESGSGSGVPKDLGTNPPYSLLTLGDRRTDQNNGTPIVGVANGQGVRNVEPGPYNGADSSSSGCSGNRQETGIRVNQSISPLFFFGFPIGCTNTPTTAAWNVTGNIFSNSPIVADAQNAGPVMVTAPDSTQGTIKARGGCSGTGFTCTNAGWTALANNEGEDPGLVTPSDYAPMSLSGLSVQSVPSDAGCKTATGIVTFTQGIYTDATALNNLFADTDCKNATFWFPPNDHGTADPSDDTQGTYYFDFRNTAAVTFQCGSDINFFGIIGTLQQDLNHEWCIGGAGSDYSGQRVIGGTPYNWDPEADPTSHTVTLAPAGSAGNGSGFWSFLQHTLFTSSANAKAIDGTTADMAMTSGQAGSSIWLSDFPEVPRGGYGLGLTLEVAQSAVNVTRMNAPTVQVRWGQLFSGGTCGPYTLPKAPADGSVGIATLSPADSANLTACLNTGDRINSATVQYNVSRPGNQGSPYPTAKLDGARFTLTTEDQPRFPQEPTATDPGGDCDPTKPGAQFIFGGDSHVYVPNGGMEVCAGPNPTNAGAGKQIAVYGVPATPRLVPTSVTATTGSVLGSTNAMRIAEGSALNVAATIPYSGTETLRFPGYTVPTGYSIDSVQLRAAYNPQAATPQFQVSPAGSSTAFCAATNATAGAGNQAQTYDVTTCMKASNRIASAYDVKWSAGTASGGCTSSLTTPPNTCPQLDGIEFIVTVSPTNPDTTLRPENGCVTVSANLWYGVAGPDCALLRVDAPFSIFGDPLNARHGRLSVKGTIYSPSAAIDIDDTDVWYPLASRGLIARHLRIRGFKYHSGYGEPAFTNWLDNTPAARQVVFYVCGQASGTCNQVNAIGRAAVTFAAVTNTPTVTNWSVSEG